MPTFGNKTTVAGERKVNIPGGGGGGGGPRGIFGGGGGGGEGTPGNFWWGRAAWFSKS